MANKYAEQLKIRYDDALVNFEKVKTGVLDEVAKMTPNTATHFGAAYASHIDQLTRAAATIEILGEQIRAYEYFTQGGNEQC